MKKKTILVGLLLVAGSIGLASCSFTKKVESQSTETVSTSEEQSSSSIVESQSSSTETPSISSTTTSSIASSTTSEVASSTTSSIASSSTTESESQSSSTQTQSSFTVSYNVCGHNYAPSSVSDVNQLTSAMLPELTDNNYDFGGWYFESSYTTKATADSAITSNITLYAKWTLKSTGETQYETVTTTCDFASLLSTYGEATKTTEEASQGKFKFEAGVYFNASSGNMTGNLVNNQQKKIYFILSGADSVNSIKFDVKGASSGTLTLYDAEGTVVYEYGKITDPQYAVEVTDLAAGTYYIASVGSVRIGNMSVTEKLVKSSPSSITVKGGTVKELQGREFTTTGLSVYLNYENGRQDRIASGYEIDYSNVNMDASGVYTVVVSYTADGFTSAFTASYTITIYEIVSVELSDYSINSSRITYPVQKVFALNEAFNSDNLAVTCTCSSPNSTKTETFILTAEEYTISGVTSTDLAGKKTIEVTVGNKTVSYDVYYLDNSASISTTNIIVDSAATGVSLGADGVYTVQTVNQAVQALKALGATSNEVKTITVMAGSYKEKVEIDIPNVKLIGSGTNSTDTVLWFDTLAGEVDPSGASSYSTDGSASVSIRATAEGFYAENITFKNYYNTDTLYNLSKTYFSDTQAVACLVQADKAYFKNCTFTSYHDTLYAMDGRQYYENCYIEGRTDYIFGAAATAYFKGCTINTIGSGDAKNGGYVVATKGTPGLLYGYIFDGCTLTSSGSVTDGTVSLARGWDNDMTVAYVNCSISKAYSLTAYETKTDGKNERYTNMNAQPKAAQLFEYNNTGEGALSQDVIDTAVSGVIANMCTYLTETEAAQFTSFDVIFNKTQQRTGATDFATSYTDNWDGTAGTTITAKTLNFAQFTQNYTGTTVQDYFADDMTLELPEVAKSVLRWNGNSAQFDIGTKITLKTQGKIYVDWYGGNYGNAANGVITYKDGYATLEIVNCPSCSGVYIKSIKVDLLDIPADTEYYDVTFDYNYDGSTDTIVNVAGDNQVSKPSDPVRDGFDFVCWNYAGAEYDFTTKVTEAITLEAQWNEIVDLVITTDTEFVFSGTSTWTGSVTAGETKKIGKMVVYGGTTGSFVNHDTSWYKLLGDATITLSIKAGAKVTITTYDGCLTVNGTAVDAADYEGTAGNMTYTYTATADCDVVFGLTDGSSQAYISNVSVETTDVLLEEITEDTTYTYDGTINSTANFALHNLATNGDWLKFGTNGRITFFVKSGAVITITGSSYDGAEAYLAIGTEELTKNASYIWAYTATADGRIDLTNDGTIYIKKIKVTYPVEVVTSGLASYSYDWADVASTYADGATVESTTEVEFAGCVKHNNQYIALKEGNAITLTLAGGATLVINMPYSSGVTVNGVAMTLDSNDNLIYTAPKGADLEVVVSATAGSAYITTIDVYTALSSYSYNFADETAKYADGDAIESNDYVTFVGCERHTGGGYIALKTGNAVTLTLAGGATLVVNMPYSVGITINGAAVELDSDNNITYTAPAGDVVKVVISTTAGQGYITTIKVYTPLSSFSYNFADYTADYADGDTIESTADVEFAGCIRHTGGGYIALKENNSITLTVAGGSILVVNMPYSSGVTVNGVAVELNNYVLTYAVPAGDALKVVISATAGSSYLTKIKVYTPLSSYSYIWANEAANYEANDTIESTIDVTFAGCIKQDDQYIALKENNSITLTIAGGATLVVNMPYSNGITINGEAVTTDSDNNVTYTAPAGDAVEVVISGTAGGAYITSITVTTD